MVKFLRVMKKLVEPTLKRMYISYVHNCKRVTPETLPMINFMQRSYAEVCAIDPELTYQHAFLYIRQMAIHLRNASLSKKKEMIQCVYNWQFVECLYLWARVLSVAPLCDGAMKPLRYPLAQIVIGSARLLPSAKFFPLRFHCVRVLLMLGASTFLPIMPLILEVLESIDFGKRLASQSLHPMNLDCLLKVSKSQLKENAFKDGIVEESVALLMECLHQCSNMIGFPELVLSFVLRLKHVLKRCRVVSYVDQLRQLVERAQAQAVFVGELRRQSRFLNLTDATAVEAVEARVKAADSPFEKYYMSWHKLRERTVQHRIAKKDEIVDLDIQKVPNVRKLAADKQEKLTTRMRAASAKSFAEIIENGGDDESASDVDDASRFLPPEERRKRPARLEALKYSSSSSGEDDDDSESEEEERASKKRRTASANDKTRKERRVTVVKKGERRKKVVKRENLAARREEDVVQDLVLSDSD